MIVKKHLSALKKRMDKSSFERAYKAYMLDLSNLIKTEVREINNTDFYSGFEGDVKKYTEVLEQAQKTFENAAKSQAFRNPRSGGHQEKSGLVVVETARRKRLAAVFAKRQTRRLPRLRDSPFLFAP